MRRKVVPLKMLLVLPLLLTFPAAAQTQDCTDALANTLSSGSEHPLLPACATEVSAELANVIRNSASEERTSQLTLLHGLTLFIRDPALFDSGTELAGNTAAEPAARVLGLSVALTQVDPALGFQSTGADRPFQGALSETCEEATFTGSDVEYWADKGPAANGESRLRTLAEAIAVNESEPLMVRRFARCVVLVLPDANPPSYEIPEWDDGTPE
jgi:hypothetical protein